jgi:ATP-binding cassette subfamily B protein
MATCLDGEIDEIGEAIACTASAVARDALVAISTAVLMLALDWHLALLALGLLGLTTLFARSSSRNVHRAHGRARTKLGEMTAYLEEVLGPRGALVVRAFAGERAEEARFGGLNQDLARLELQAAMAGRRAAVATATAEAVAPALIVLAGGYLAISDRMTVGTVFVFAALLMPRLAGAASGLRGIEARKTHTLALFRRLFAAIDHETDVADMPGARPLRSPRGGVWLDRVSFAYPRQARPALHDFSAIIEPGQTVALVGPPGAGKRTVAALIPRFYDPQRGTVRIDGRDAREVTLASLRQAVATIFPETFLFNGTIRDNLRYARADATEAQVVAASRAAYLHHFICTLPEGYDTIVGARGRRLSAGELRRIGIARAILRDPRVLVIHDSVDDVDNISEHLIQAALAPLLAERTCVVITERPALLRAADQVLLLDGGRLVDRGTHYDLLARNELYATLVDEPPPRLMHIPRGALAPR